MGAELASPVTILVREPGRVTAGGGEPLVLSRGVKRLLQRVVHRAGQKRAAAILSEEQKVAANDAAPAACADSSAKCADWAKSGECDSNPGFMHKTCAKSCGKCAPAAACVDSNPKCAEWKGSGECDRNPKFMLETCRKSCGKC